MKLGVYQMVESTINIRGPYYALCDIKSFAKYHSFYRHGSYLQDHPYFRLTSVCDNGIPFMARPSTLFIYTR